MPRKYSPVVEETMYDYDPNTYYTAEMEESKYGEWVKLETFLNVRDLLTAQIERLKKKIKQLEEQ